MYLTHDVVLVVYMNVANLMFNTIYSTFLHTVYLPCDVCLSMQSTHPILYLNKHRNINVIIEHVLLRIFIIKNIFYFQSNKVEKCFDNTDTRSLYYLKKIINYSIHNHSIFYT